MTRKSRLIAVLTIAVVATALLLGGCAQRGAPVSAQQAEPPSLAGTYVGYSWGGEARGTSRDDATAVIETILTLDAGGTIQDATMRYWVRKEGFWTTRQAGNTYIAIDYGVTPQAARPGSDYSAGTSMFTVYTADTMSLYMVGVNSAGVVATGIVCPVTRYLYETRLPADFDYSRRMGQISVGSGLLVPTVRTSGSGLLRPNSWDEVAGKTIFDIHHWSHVVNSIGPLAGIGNNSTVREYLEALGVTFEGGRPVAMSATYGHFGKGGWPGNYDAIAESLRGRNAREYTSLVDWSVPRFADSVNDSNVFGADVPSGATRTVQNSADGISGATVRISRESTSYQRALVAAGILDESDVIIGRF